MEVFLFLFILEVSEICKGVRVGECFLGVRNLYARSRFRWYLVRSVCFTKVI